MRTIAALSPVLTVLCLACGGDVVEQAAPATDDAASQEADMRRDVHSFARPDEVAIRHLSLDLKVDFDASVLYGRASLELDRRQAADALYLDTRDLTIDHVTLDEDPEHADFTLGEEQGYLGRSLRIPLTGDTQTVHITYETSPGAAAVQWLSPDQTADGAHPFLFTQSQAILARTWVPCQDTPGVRMTYDATVQVPPALMAVMSADGNARALREDGVYRFSMPQAIPSYLLALAVGDLRFAEIGPRTGVYAEPSVVAAAAREFDETESMMTAVEELYGPYRWGRYDILVLPASFPFGGMENPRLTFATPTIIAGDRSLVALVAHELAHSWSGNLVTNATWNDFWLNEGFTVYLEQRIMEAVKGRDYADMLALLARQDLDATLEDVSERDSHLFLDLAGRDPDDGMTDVAYNKGYFFLRTIEEAVGRERFDPLLRTWFDDNAFESRTTTDFVGYLETALFATDPALAESIDPDAWIFGPGLPPNAPALASEAFAAVDQVVATWRDGDAAESDTGAWTTHHWLHFLRGLEGGLDPARMAALDAAFGFTESGNSEIRHAWFHHVIDTDYQTAFPALETFLLEVGRRKFLKPLYENLAETPAHKRWARDVYARARPGYHSVSTQTIDGILGDPTSANDG